MKHAYNWNGCDVTLCSLANEAGDDSLVTGETENPQYANCGELVTCPDCRRVIDHVHKYFSASRPYLVKVKPAGDV